MELLSSINNSGIGAQYAVSAAKDVNGNEITSTYLTAVPEGYATESFVTSQGYITGSYLTADALDNVSGDWNTVTNKLDSTAFSTVSGSFLTAHQPLPSSANWNAAYNTVNGNSATWNSTYNTVHDNSASWTGGGASVTSPRGTININGDEVEGTNSAIITGTAGGFIEYLLTATNHIETNPTVLTNGTLETMQTGGTLVIPVQGSDPSLYITVTGETTGGGTATASGQGSAGISNLIYIPLGEMSGPFSAQSTYWVNISYGLLTASAAPTTGIIGVGELAWNSALTPIRNASADWKSTYNTVAVNSASWGAGSTYTGDAQGALDEVYTNSGDWNTVTDKLNTTAFSTVSGNFLTAHQALPNSGNWDSTYTTVSTNSADWNSAAAMNELPVSAGEGMDIQNVDGTIVFSCTGGSVPEGVLVESGLEYNANNEISGYSGSAFAQPSISAAEWNSNYETVNTNSGAWGGDALPISAGPGVKVELTDGKLLFSTDETVLYTSTVNAKTTAFTLSEPLTAFEKVRFEITGYTHVYAENTHQTPSANTEEITTCFTYYTKSTDGNPLQMMMGTYSSTDGLNYGLVRSKFLYMPNTGITWNGSTADGPHLQKIIGINRTAGGN